MGEWIRITRNHVASLRVVAFPFEAIPQDYAPQSTVFELEDGQRVHPYMWCYLERKTARFSELNSTSLSHLRIQAMPAVMARLSTRARFENARPQTVLSRFRCLTQFLTWADAAEHDGRFEQVFSDPNLALEALMASMSRRGNCHDNAVAESFFQLLKRERIRRQIYPTRDLARSDVFHYIEMFYNPRRRHGTAEGLSPVEFERRQSQRLKSV